MTVGLVVAPLSSIKVLSPPLPSAPELPLIVICQLPGSTFSFCLALSKLSTKISSEFTEPANVNIRSLGAKIVCEYCE